MSAESNGKDGFILNIEVNCAKITISGIILAIFTCQ